jgi:hypothetical protein
MLRRDVPPRHSAWCVTTGFAERLEQARKRVQACEADRPLVPISSPIALARKKKADDYGETYPKADVGQFR